MRTAVKLVLEPIFEADFEGTLSLGFRPGLGLYGALQAAGGHARKRFHWVVDVDIEQFFDTLDHLQLMTETAKESGVKEEQEFGDGAVRRLRLRTRVFKEELLPTFWEWYPQFPPAAGAPMPVAA